MADDIGVLGESTSNTAVGTYTVYTVPAGKAARIKLFHRHLMASTGTLAFAINGITIATSAAATGADHYYSTSAKTIQDNGTTEPSGADADNTPAPSPYEYYLSAGDIVSFTVGVVATTSSNVQVVGSEIDVS